MPQNIERLVNQAQHGQPAAFKQLYMSYAPLVRTLCLERTSDWHAACDITQDVFLAVLEDIGSLKHARRFQQWLLGIARYKMTAYFKEQVRSSKQHSCFDAELLAGAFEPAEQEMLQRLQEAIEHLPEVQRIAIRLFHLEGVPVREIVDLLGMPMRTVYAALARGRNVLQRRLAKY
jgi:RNA polymerase sigma-70 factor (ECF subfamily)